MSKETTTITIDDIISPVCKVLLEEDANNKYRWTWRMILPDSTLIITTLQDWLDFMEVLSCDEESPTGIRTERIRRKGQNIKGVAIFPSKRITLFDRYTPAGEKLHREKQRPEMEIPVSIEFREHTAEEKHYLSNEGDSKRPLTMEENLLFTIATRCPDLDKKNRKKPSHWEVFLAAWKDRLSTYEMARKKGWKRETAQLRKKTIEDSLLSGNKIEDLCFDSGLLNNIESQLKETRKHNAQMNRRDLLDNTTSANDDEE